MRRLFVLLSVTTVLVGSAPVMAAERRSAEAVAASALSLPPSARKGAAIGTWGFDTSGMDRSVDPGDSMYGYANGVWARKTAIPADKSNYGMFTMLADLSDERTRAIIDEAGRTPGSKIGDLYASFMNRGADEAASRPPGGGDHLAIDQASTKAELARIAGDLARKGVTVPVFGFVGADDKNPKSNIYQIFQGGTGLPDRDYYLSDDAGLPGKRSAYQS